MCSRYAPGPGMEMLALRRLGKETMCGFFSNCEKMWGKVERSLYVNSSREGVDSKHETMLLTHRAIIPSCSGCATMWWGPMMVNEVTVG